MPTTNIFAIIVAGLIPSIIGALYYGPILGKAWRASLGKTEAELAPSNPALAYGGSMLLSILLASSLNFTIGLVHKDVNEAGALFINSHFTFAHGALHGAMIGLMTIAPIVVSLGIFHKLSWKTNLMNVVFWVICLAMMGGILDVWR